MKITIAPNSFRGGLPADVIGSAIAEGVLAAIPGADVTVFPLADGGDGTLQVLAEHYRAELVQVPVRDPLGRRVVAQLGISSDRKTAIVEMAEASGLRRVSSSERDPAESSTLGTGELIRAALDFGARRIIVGTGGSATIDVGVGALAALGAVPRDSRGHALPPIPRRLKDLSWIDCQSLDRRLRETEIVVLSDVATPLDRNPRLYGRQKGVRPGTQPLLEGVINVVADLAAAGGCNILSTPWYGAGGGMAGGFAAFLRASVVSGATSIMKQVGVDNCLGSSDLVLTAEGRFDLTSLEGKLPCVVAEHARRLDVPCVIFTGRTFWPCAAPPPYLVRCINPPMKREPLHVAMAHTAPRLKASVADFVHRFLAQRGRRACRPEAINCESAASAVTPSSTCRCNG